MAVKNQKLEEMILSSWNVAMQERRDSVAMSKLDDYIENNTSMAYKENKFQNINKKEKAVSLGHKFLGGGFLFGGLMIFEIGLWPLMALCVGTAGVSYFLGSSLATKISDKIGKKFLWRFFNKGKYVEKSKANIYEKIKAQLVVCRDTLKENESLLKGKVDLDTMRMYLQNRLDIVTIMSKECEKELGNLRDFTEKTKYNYSDSKKFYSECYKLIYDCVESEKINIEVFDKIKGGYMDGSIEKDKLSTSLSKGKDKGEYEYFSVDKNVDNSQVVVDDKDSAIAKTNNTFDMSDVSRQIQELDAEIEKAFAERGANHRWF